MKRRPGLLIVLVTAPDVSVARKLGRAALDRRLIACANIVPRIESYYWWKGQIEHSTEILLLLKTTKRRLPKLHNLILEMHPYDTPEFVVLESLAVTERYLRWAMASVK